MKKSLVFLFFCSCLLMLACEKEDISIWESEVYYYYNGEKIYLDTDPTVLYVSLSGEQSLGNLHQLLKNDEKSALEDRGTRTFGDERFYYAEVKFSKPLSKDERRKAKRKIEDVPGVQLVMPGLLPKDGVSMGVSNIFYVKLKHESDYHRLANLARRNKIKVRGQDKYMPLWYTLSCDRNSKLNPIDGANHFFKSGLFESTEPEFIMRNLHNGSPW